MKSPYLTEDHEIFRKEVRKFVEKEVLPNVEKWEQEQRIPREFWEKLGALGFLGINFPEKYGGVELDIFYSFVFVEELLRCGSGGLGAAVIVQQYMAAIHLSRAGSEELKQKYLVPSIEGKKVGALAITEPNTGSDVSAIATKAERDGDYYIVNGAKTFITNGHYGDFITAAVKTTQGIGADGISLIVIDREAPGVTTRKLKKLGWHCSDTAEIHFDNVKVPAGNLIGDENMGFYYIMESFQLERLMSAVLAYAGAEYCIEETIKYASEREVFKRPIAKFQVLRHTLADLAAETEAAKQLTYYTGWLHQEGEQAVKESSMSKMLATELANKVVDRCLQIFGGYGYMEEYLICRAYRDARVGTIVAGTTEIMREIISKIIIDEVQYDSGYQKEREEREAKRAEQEGGEQEKSDAVKMEVEEPTEEEKKALPKNVDELFAGITERFRPERAEGWDSVLHFDITGPEGGQYSIIVKDQNCTVEKGLVGDPKCVIKAKAKIYMDMELGRTNPQVAYMMRKVKVSNLPEMMRYIKVFKKLFKRKKK